MSVRLHNRRMIAAAGALLSLLLLVVAIAHSHSSTSSPSRPAGATEGITQRSPLADAGLGTSIPASVSCFTAYVAQPAGRDAAGQHYALTLTLAAEPASAGELVRLLSTGGCSAQQQRILGEFEHARGVTPMPGEVTIDYRTPSGARIVLPAG